MAIAMENASVLVQWVVFVAHLHNSRHTFRYVALFALIWQIQCQKKASPCAENKNLRQHFSFLPSRSHSPFFPVYTLFIHHIQRFLPDKLLLESLELHTKTQIRMNTKWAHILEECTFAFSSIDGMSLSLFRARLLSFMNDVLCAFVFVCLQTVLAIGSYCW